MKPHFPCLVIVVVFALGEETARAQSNECPIPINGARRGEPGNIQDNMFHSLAIDPTDENVIYAGTEANGIFKTTDGGAHWMRLRNGLKCTSQHTGYSQIFDISIDPTNPRTLYASTVNGPGPAFPVTYPSASAGVYKSTNGGLTWTQRDSGFTNTYTCYVLVDSTNPRRLYAGIGGVRSAFPPTFGQFFFGGILLSTDTGLSWSPLSLPQGVNTNVPINMVIRGSSQEIIYASWQLHRTDSSTAYGLIKSTDGGQSWSVINPPGTLFYSFDVAKQNPNLVYANDTTMQRRVHRSTDGGATWTPIPTASFFGEIRIHPTNSQVLFVTGQSDIRRSTDGLLTSTAVYTDTGLASYQQMNDIKISQSNPNVVWACAKGYYVYRSTDGGNSFTKITAIRDSVYSDPVNVQGEAFADRIQGFSLSQNYPNPFNPRTNIKYHLPAISGVNGQVGIPSSDYVTLKVFDVLGREVATLVNGMKQPGTHSVRWDASGIGGGVYLYRLTVGTFVETRKMCVIK